MSPKPYLLYETNWKTVKDQKFEIAILPWGATEAHNFHLPYSTDIIQSDYIAEESARLAWEKGAKIMVLPTVPYGVNTGQLDIKFTISINPSTQAAVLNDVVNSLFRQEINKLVIINGHGGNSFIPIIREIQPNYPKMFICTLNWYEMVNLRKFFSDTGDHGGEMETSNMLYIAPDLILPLSEAGEGKESKFKIKGIKEGWVWAQREWTKVTKDTGIGNPAKATAQKGTKYLKDITEKIADFLVDLVNSNINDLYE